MCVCEGEGACASVCEGESACASVCERELECVSKFTWCNQDKCASEMNLKNY